MRIDHVDDRDIDGVAWYERHHRRRDLGAQRRDGHVVAAKHMHMHDAVAYLHPGDTTSTPRAPAASALAIFAGPRSSY